MNKYEFQGILPLCTRTGIEIARDFTRIIHGGRGAYVEIDQRSIKLAALKPVVVPHVYYNEYRTEDGVKLYYQRRTVKYADYKIGMWYVSPRDLQGFKIIGEYSVPHSRRGRRN